MSIENIMKFYNEAVKDEVLRNKLQGINEKTLTKEVFESKVLPEAKAKGYDFSYADVQEYYKKQSETTELNVDELENVSGGGCGSTSDVPIGQDQGDSSKDYVSSPSQKACSDYYDSRNGVPRERAMCSDCKHLRMEGPQYYCKVHANS